MNDHANSSLARFAPILEKFFGDKLELAWRPVEDIFARAHNDKPYTLQQHKDWFRGAVAPLEKLGLVKRYRPGGQNSSVTHLILLAPGKQLLGDLLVQKQQGAAGLGDDKQKPSDEQHDESMSDVMVKIRDIERYCELSGYQFNWAMTNQKEVFSSK